ncbi:MAG: DNA mismatch repair protein MutS [Lachnospiraceae bacterium]
MTREFSEGIKKEQDNLTQKNKAFLIAGYVKLMLVILLCIGVYFLFQKKLETGLLVLDLLGLLVLIVVSIYQGKLQEKIQYSQGIIQINQRYLDRINGTWSDFQDVGEEFKDPNHPYACDLDIVGKKSIFQLLNTTNTWYGRKAFAEDLLDSAYSRQEIQLRQAAVEELRGKVQLGNRMEYYTSKIGKDPRIEQLVLELQDREAVIRTRGLKWLLSLFPMITVGVLVWMSISNTTALLYLGLGCILLHGVVLIAGKPRLKKYLSTAQHLSNKLGAYREAMSVVEEQEFTSEKLQKMKQKLGTPTGEAQQAIRKLGRIAKCLSVKNNELLYVLLNLFFLWDYQCAFLLEGWKKNYAGEVKTWFLMIGELESLISFSNLGKICNRTCLPEILKEEGRLAGEELGHPLLNNTVRVTNSLKMKDNIFIISGSNMSGKTTFLRTVGINLVLGQAGGFVCAESMEFSKVKIMTSMRIADDLNQGISTFYAELKRIRAIMEVAKTRRDLIFLIDEIFRGTNSVDRMSGARAVLEKLKELGVMGIITTHDLELCSLEEQYSGIKNYSFSEYYEAQKICFDYKMNPGKSTVTNGKYLMELVGILG